LRDLQHRCLRLLPTDGSGREYGVNGSGDTSGNGDLGNGREAPSPKRADPPADNPPAPPVGETNPAPGAAAGAGNPAPAPAGKPDHDPVCGLKELDSETARGLPPLAPGESSEDYEWIDDTSEGG
jgi:hypothetical protein